MGTPYYVAPEVLLQAYGFPADVWSAGVAAYQLLTGRFPWHADPDWVEEQVRLALRSHNVGVCCGVLDGICGCILCSCARRPGLGGGAGGACVYVLPQCHMHRT